MVKWWWSGGVVVVAVMYTVKAPAVGDRFGEESVVVLYYTMSLSCCT